MCNTQYERNKIMNKKEFAEAVSYIGLGGMESYLPIKSSWADHAWYFNRQNEKNYQIIRDYGKGAYKVIAKEHPPVKRGTKRNIATFRRYDRKLYNSITRSKQTVYELAKCNKWTYFVTLTINRKKHDCSDIDAFMKTLIKWFNNYSDRKIVGTRCIRYVLIPEMGRSGAWHIHGLMRGIPLKHLSKFEKGKHPQRLVDKDWLNWKAYSNKFGFCCLSRIRNNAAAVRYSTKKIAKSYHTQMRGHGKRLYYCSKGLKRSTEVCRGYNLLPIYDYDFENEWVAIKWIYDNR